MPFQRALTVLFAVGIFFSACKEPTIDDTALLPEDQLDLNFTDTLTIESSFVEEDTMNVTGATLCLLGSMHDPELGYTNASFYIPFKLKDNNLALDDTTVTLDSVVLMMWYFEKSAYGELRVPQTVEVFEMSEALVDSLDYTSDKTFSTYPNPVGAKTFIPNTKDSIKVGGVTYPPSLRIRLDNNWGEKFTNASGTSAYEDNENFRDFFKGLYVSPGKAGGGKGLVAFDPYQNGVKITLYYHDAQDSAFSYDFAADPGYVVNHYVHDYRNSFLNSAGDSLLLIQGLSGMNAKITVPHIRNLGNILINKAELVLTVIPGDSTFAAPEKLTALKSDEDGKFNGVTNDQVSPSSAIFGGAKTTTTDTTGQKLTQYKFNLSRYYQEVILEERQDYGIFILPDKRYQIPNRLVAGGSNHSKYSVKLNLIYDVIE